MRIAVLSDVHANLPALKAVLADARKRDCQRIYHAGDLIAIGPHPAEVVDAIQQVGARCVQGNHEQLLNLGIPACPTQGMDDDERMHQHWTHSRLDMAASRFLRELPMVLEEELCGVSLTVLHFALDDTGQAFVRTDPRGSDEAILSLFGNAQGRLICFGHIHLRVFNAPFGGRHFLNAGGVGCSHDSTAGYAVVELDDGEFRIELRRVAYDRASLLKRYDELEIPARDFIRTRFFGVKVDR